MSKLNRPRPGALTHEEARAYTVSPEATLRRSVMACLLWEDQFYEAGESIADRIAKLVPQVPAEKVAGIAIEARERMNLRHVPLLLACEMAKHETHRGAVEEVVARIVQRPDELTELLAIYSRDRKGPKKLGELSAGLKRGIARAFTKFDAYQLAKYDRPGEIKLRDALFLSHAKPRDTAQAEVWQKLVAGKLEPPDTWEVGLSSGANKRETWERLLAEKKLGALALLRNLRNMLKTDVPTLMIVNALAAMRVDRVLPFRFVAAALAAPGLEDAIDEAFLRCARRLPKLPGKTLIVVDVSGSMYGEPVSKRSDLDRAQAAAALAAIAREQCELSAIYATAGYDMRQVHRTEQVPPRHGMALVAAIYGMCTPLGGGGIFTSQVLDFLRGKERDVERIIVVTDEQDTDRSRSPMSAEPFGNRNYLVNVASYQNGVGYGKWTHVDGWSEAVLEYVRTSEVSDGGQQMTDAGP